MGGFYGCRIKSILKLRKRLRAAWAVKMRRVSKNRQTVTLALQDNQKMENSLREKHVRIERCLFTHIALISYINYQMAHIIYDHYISCTIRGVIRF